MPPVTIQIDKIRGKLKIFKCVTGTQCLLLHILYKLN